MKIFLLVLLFIVSSFGFSQDNHIVKTEDGRRVLLKADFTWEYIDLEKPTIQDTIEENTKNPINNCNVGQDFEEPKLNAKNQNQLKKGRATINHIKKKVAKDYNCSTDDVLLLTVSEKKESGLYTFCAKGQKVTYKRIGSTIIKKGKLF